MLVPTESEEPEFKTFYKPISSKDPESEAEAEKISEDSRLHIYDIFLQFMLRKQPLLMV